MTPRAFLGAKDVFSFHTGTNVFWVHPLLWCRHREVEVHLLVEELKLYWRYFRISARRLQILVPHLSRQSCNYLSSSTDLRKFAICSLPNCCFYNVRLICQAALGAERDREWACWPWLLMLLLWETDIMSFRHNHRDCLADAFVCRAKARKNQPQK